jgi:hypothetical protein
MPFWNVLNSVGTMAILSDFDLQRGSIHAGQVPSAVPLPWTFDATFLWMLYRAAQW